MDETLILVAGGVVAYLMGSFSSAVWIGKWFYDTDVRTQGSGNAGATNTIRVLGIKAGIIVMILDIVKAWCAVMLARFIATGRINPDQLVEYQMIVGALAVLGHVFPVFTGFKGGKGVASLVGVIIALYSPFIFLIVLSWFIVVFILTRYVSLASISAAILFSVLAIFIFPQQNTYLIILAAMIAIFIPLTHFKNIKRLLRGEESKLTFRKKIK
ncbi:MAG: glycerol-3-phosphate 1-O-acyltransferase PlsY [Bacteroidota bacterium]